MEKEMNDQEVTGPAGGKSAGLAFVFAPAGPWAPLTHVYDTRGLVIFVDLAEDCSLLYTFKAAAPDELVCDCRAGDGHDVIVQDGLAFGPALFGDDAGCDATLPGRPGNETANAFATPAEAGKFEGGPWSQLISGF